jgi:hypothetical protein
MFLRVLDAFDEDTKHAQQYSAIAAAQAELRRTYSGWDPSNGPSAASDVRLEQKRREMVLADLTLVASRYVEGTIREFYPHKEIARVPYGVDVEFWTPEPTNKPAGPLRFIYAGQVSLRKGVPLLVEGRIARCRARACRFLASGELCLRALRGFLLALGRRSASAIESPMSLCSHRFLTVLDWFCSRPWHVVCLRSLPRQASVRKSLQPTVDL